VWESGFNPQHCKKKKKGEKERGKKGRDFLEVFQALSQEKESTMLTKSSLSDKSGHGTGLQTKQKVS
jgi:uncharacterized protein YaaR (DUF327 family)